MSFEYIYDAKKTPQIVFDDNIKSFSSAQLDEWNKPVQEGRGIAGEGKVHAESRCAKPASFVFLAVATWTAALERISLTSIPRRLATCIR